MNYRVHLITTVVRAGTSAARVRSSKAIARTGLPLSFAFRLVTPSAQMKPLGEIANKSALELKKVMSKKDAEINLLNTTITNSTQFPLQSADSGFQIDKLHIGLMVTCVVFVGLVITLAVCLWRAAQQHRKRACHPSDNEDGSLERDCDEIPLMEIVSDPPPASAPPPEDNGSGYETGSNPSRTSSQRNSPAQERKGDGPSQPIHQPTTDDNGSQRELALPQEVKLKPPVQDVSASIATVENKV
ncbi:hypothetical protein BaRGS_00006853 [Batillaria attramentaria]|uniref:Uncharacterized protein n=1 Tax=Batillaria attramentaria TaxID=370345 RepID=A0ABD0LSG4_9CAEN